MKLSKKLFYRFNIATIIAVYILILVGGIVRSVGAGMGCPDWPKCFGQYVPPTSADQLPDNYKEIFLEKRVSKNERFAKTLTGLGFDNLAARITNDPNVKAEEDFSVIKAWIEYINRLIGAVIGLFIVLNVVFSFSYWNVERKVTVVAILSLILVLFQGWIGSLVVSTNLLPGFISFHMGLALLLVAMLIWIHYRISPGKKVFNKVNTSLYVLLFVLFVPHLFLGTQVREQIDQFVMQGVERANWIANTDWMFYVHRTFSLVLAGLMVYMLYRHIKNNALNSTDTGFWLLIASVLVAVEIVGGAVMAYFSVPAFIQPVHLFAASILFGILYYLILLGSNKRSVNE